MYVIDKQVYRMESISKKDVETILKYIKCDKDLCTKVRIHFEEILDEEYVPPKRQVKKEYYSDHEGSCSSEEEYEVGMTSEGHLYLK